MKITKFEDAVEQKILDRGFDYYESDYILDFEKIGDDTFKGFVRGTNLYNVIVRINNELEIVSASCDCPYNYGRYCKHQVALMYMITDLEAFDSNYELTGNVKVVENIIRKMKKGELVDLIKNICIVDRTSLNRVLIELGIDDDAFEEAIRYYE